MPELPEVEAARRAIEEHCVGKRIVRSTVADDAKVIDGVARSDFESSIAGKTIVAALRKGKNMWIQLDSPPFPSFQFGMAGAIYIKGVAVTNYKRSAVKDTDEWPSKYSKVFVELDDGLEFSFIDKRRFAKVRLLDNPASMPPISELGPDALLQPMTLIEFQNSLSKKKIGIKALLLDQSFISGIGNWMADEVLYQAKIHPMQIASSISKESCATLLQCINKITEVAVEVDADSLRFPDAWLFHLRWGKKPGNLNGRKIEFINAGGRTTAYIPELQKLTGNQAIKGEVDESKVEKASKKAKVVKVNDKNNKLSKAKKSTADDSDSPDDDEDDRLDSDEITPTKRNQRHSRRQSKRKEENSEDENSDDTESSKAKTTNGKRKKAGETVQKGKRKGRAK